ncbi:carboxypeptidase B-like [Lytechinus variegatus]|uniref:carboxypeptidase B-like n=1 Tax=Lytechinus variegatus TaxID=7654 RepID=UPI001BB2B29C|nr:carboxypeptidase B-like [Lytechinus variegatus]
MKLLIISLLVALAVAEKVRYDGYQTLRIEPKGAIQNDYIHHLAETLDEKYDFWTHTRNGFTDVMMAPNLVGGFKYLLESRDIDYHVMIEDVQKLIDNQDGILPSAGFYETYHSYDEIQTWVTDMANQYSIAEEMNFATSYLGKPINGLKISKSTGGSTKRIVYFQGGIHAREWISPATVMYMTYQLLENNGEGFLDEFDFYIIPSLNVDGYQYSWTNDRMWRKTRSTYEGNACDGVDPNRNYMYEWGGSGSSSLSCSDIYRGPAAHSEPEVSGTTSLLETLKDQGRKFACFIDFHSYSQLWLSPYSYMERDAENHATQVGAAEEACAALQAVHGTRYTFGASASTLYAADGCSVDWGYAELEATYSYVVELRDKGRYGFLLPENQILPTGEETYAGIKALLNNIKNNS